MPYNLLTKCAHLLVITGIIAAWGCGSGGGGGGSEEPIATVFQGSVVDKSGNPIPDVGVFIFETYENSITDENGEFTLESYKHLPSAGMFFKRDNFSNKVELGKIPDDAVAVVAGFMIDTATNQAEIIGVDFPTTFEPTPTPEETPPTTGTPGPGGTPTPRGTPTPKPGNFDANGNTTAFGIPNGMTGNIGRGSSVWGGQCSSCHGVEKKNRSYGQIKNSFNVVPTMKALPTTKQQMADVTAYLNRGRK